MGLLIFLFLFYYCLGRSNVSVPSTSESEKANIEVEDSAIIFAAFDTTALLDSLPLESDFVFQNSNTNLSDSNNSNIGASISTPLPTTKFQEPSLVDFDINSIRFGSFSEEDSKLKECVHVQMEPSNMGLTTNTTIFSGVVDSCSDQKTKDHKREQLRVQCESGVSGDVTDTGLVFHMHHQELVFQV